MRCIALLLSVLVFTRVQSADIRLDGGDDDNAGRLQVYNADDEEYGYVYDGGFGDNEAQVVCQSLGYVGADTILDAEAAVELFGDCDEDAEVYLDDLSCDGNEDGIGSCSSTEDYDEDNLPVAIVCSEDTIDVQLVGGENPWEGRLEVEYDGEFGTVSDSDFGDDEAEIVCAQLGYYGGVVVSNEAFGEADSDQAILLEGVDCDGSEELLAQCAHNGWGESSSDHEDDVAIECDPVPPTAAPTTAAPGTAAPTTAAATTAAATAAPTTAAATAAATTAAATAAPTTAAATAAAVTQVPAAVPAATTAGAAVTQAPAAAVAAADPGPVTQAPAAAAAAAAVTQAPAAPAVDATEPTVVVL